MKTEQINEESKWLEYFALKYNPFPVAPDTDGFYLTENVNRILAEIVHGVVTRKGFMVFTGEIGLGKTTISRKLIGILEGKGVETSLVFHTFYQDAELLREINRDFGLQVDSLLLSDQMKILKSFLLKENRKGGNCAIIIDDAQNLDQKSLELIRMLSNLEADRQKLVQILLIGQPELMDKLNAHELRQLKSRIMIREEARPLNEEELRSYVLFKLNAAGNTGTTTVTKNAIKRIYKLTGGNFRQVNTLMERCLYVAFLHDTTNISRQIVNEAQRDLSPEESAPIKRPLLWGLLVTLALYLTAGVLYPGIFFKLPFVKGEAQVVIPRCRKKIREKAVLSDQAKAIAKKGIPVATGPIPQPVADFLAAYNLSDFEKAFFDGLEKNLLGQVASTILEQTGYQMVQLDRLPDNVRARYAILSLSSANDGNERYLLFWKPQVRVKKFYLGYQGKEIISLERLLAGIDLYHHKPDGIVGRRLMRAINHFQEMSGLTITGFPDEKTIFLLCEAQEVGSRE